MPSSFVPDAQMRTSYIQAIRKRNIIANTFLAGCILIGLAALAEILMHGTMYFCILFLPVAVLAVVSGWRSMSCLEIRDVKNRLREQLAFNKDGFVETFNSTAYSSKPLPGQCQRHVLFRDIDRIFWDPWHLRWVIRAKKSIELLFDAPEPGLGAHPYARVERKNRPVYIYSYYTGVDAFIAELSAHCGVPVR